MKTAIICVSTHHGNTRKLADAIAAQYEVTLIDAVHEKTADLAGYDLIGVASGVAFGKYYPQMLSFLEANAPEGKKVFFMHTAGDPREGHANAAKAIMQAHHCECVGIYCCKGFDTSGPFKLIGGIAMGHPTDVEIKSAV